MKSVFRTASITLAALAVTLVLTVACGEDDDAEPTVTASLAGPTETAASSPGSEPSGEPIKIGTTVPLSGPGAGAGEEGRLGVELAVRYANEAGGVLGRPVELVVYDDKTSPEDAAAGARRLIEQDNVVGMVSAYTSTMALAQKPIIEEAGLPTVYGLPGSTAIVDSPNEWGFRSSVEQSARAIGRPWAEWMVNELGVNSVYILGGRGAFEDSHIASMKELWSELGVEVVGEDRFEPTETDLTARLSNFGASGADWLYLTVTTPASQVIIYRQAAELGVLPERQYKMLQGPWGVFSQTLTEAGQYMDGLVTAESWTFGCCDDELSRRFEADFEAETGRKPLTTSVAPAEFVAAQTLLDAIERAGSTDPEAIREALLSTDLESLYRVKFDENHNNVGIPFIFVAWLSGEGKYDVLGEYKPEIE